MPLEYAGRTHDTTSRWFGFSLREQVSKRVTLGMYGGYAWLTQSSNPVTAGIELDGFHAGFSLHGVLLEGQRTSLYGTLDYGYQKVDHKDDSQTVVIDWAQPQAQLGVMLTLARHWRLYGGGSYGKIDGEERASGTVNHTPVYPREVMKRALILNASALLVVHNHPSGDPKPSREDIQTTRELKAAASALEVELHDHVVIGHGTHASFRSLGLL